MKFTEDGTSKEQLSEAYGANGSFHAANLEQEYQKRLVVSNKFFNTHIQWQHKTVGKWLTSIMLSFYNT